MHLLIGRKRLYYAISCRSSQTLVPGTTNQLVHQTPSTMSHQEENDYDELRPHLPARPTKPEDNKATAEFQYE